MWLTLQLDWLTMLQANPMTMARLRYGVSLWKGVI